MPVSGQLPWSIGERRHPSLAVSAKPLQMLTETAVTKRRILFIKAKRDEQAHGPSSDPVELQEAQKFPNRVMELGMLMRSVLYRILKYIKRPP